MPSVYAQRFPFFAPSVFLSALILTSGCEIGTTVDQKILAKQVLMQSYAARYEFGAIFDVTVKNETKAGIIFDVKGSKQNGTFAAMGRLGPNSIPICSITLEDGRQIPLFQDFLEESYKRDLESQ